MKTCMNCGNEVTGRGKYCGESCKTIFNRNKRNTQPEPEQHKPEHLEPEHVTGTVYERQAIHCYQYGTRPMPLDPTDIPHKGGRGKYTRQDGSEYQFDAVGRAFDLTNGLVYQTVEEVRACYR